MTIPYLDPHIGYPSWFRRCTVNKHAVEYCYYDGKRSDLYIATYCCKTCGREGRGTGRYHAARE